MIKKLKNKLYYSPEVRQDLEEIYEYIQTELSNPQAADTLITEILDAVDDLNDFPESGALLNLIIKEAPGYRYLVVKNYLIFYRFEEHTIYVDRILYGRRNYLKILFDLEEG